MRTDTLFGKNVNVVGNISADLVLESLGNIYVKSRNKALTLDEIIKSLGAGSTEELAQKTIILDSLDLLDSIIIKDGALVYDKNSLTLYIQIDGELVELINVSTNDTRYVKKTGDTMTGQLRINVPAGKAPLTVNSAILNKNFNAQYLEGLPSSAFALKAKNENISGSWSFSKNTYFKAPVYFQDNTMHYKDSLHAGSLGTPNFASGFGGYGWRIDAETNTLTIDYIVVRKAMYVYELVVNKISATNGSLWVSNSSKVKFACKLNLITGSDSTFNSWFISPGSWTGDSSTQETRDIATYLNGMLNNEGFIISSTVPPLRSLTGAELSSNTQAASTGENFYNFKDLKVIMCTDQVKARDLGSNNPSFSFRLDQVTWEGNTENNGYGSECFHAYRLFSPYFDTEVVFPIVHLLNDLYKYNSGGTSKEVVYGTPKYVKTYYKYFGQKADSYNYSLSTKFYLVQFDTDNLPVFLPGDILRCQKFTGNGIKYYDAVVCNKLNDSYFIILLGSSIMDKTTVITYNDNLQPTTTTETEEINSDFYDRTGHRSNDIYGMVQEGDDIVLIGHLWDINRQNALYLTSSDDGAPYIDTMSQVNRPDYSVVYYTPAFETIKLYKGGDFPFTGQYYVLKDDAISTGQYAIAYLTEYGIQPNNFYSIALNSPVTQITIWYKDRDGNVKTMLFDQALEHSDREWILEHKVRLLESAPLSTENQNPLSLAYIKSLICTKYGLSNLDNYTVKVLRGYPDLNTLLVVTRNPEDLTTELGESFTMEEANSLNVVSNENHIILEDTHDKSSITSTRTTKARIGRLDGIIDERFGPKKQPTGYGLYGENVYLTGEFILSNGKNVIDFDKDIMSLLSGLEMSSQMYLNLMDLLKNLADNTPSYGNLEAAGIFLTKNKLILYGDSIMIITRGDELDGSSAPTALFADGKINAKFLAALIVRSSIPLYTGTNPQSLASSSIYIGGSYYTGDSIVYEYKKPITSDTFLTLYVRRYYRGNDECWIVTDIYGNPVQTVSYHYAYTSSCSPTEYEARYSSNAYSSPPEAYSSSPKFVVHFYNYNNSTGLYDSRETFIKVADHSYLFVTFKNFNLDNTYTEYTWNVAQCAASNNITYDGNNEPVYNNNNLAYIKYKSSNYLLDVVMWSLNFDGSGNLGGNGIVWDTDHHLTITGVINASSGKIGNLNIADSYLYKNVLSEVETLTSFLIGGSDGNERLEITNWSTYSCDAGIINSRTLLNSSMLEITLGKSMSASKNGVQLTSEGLVWKKDGIPITSSSILFSIVLIPIRDNKGLWLPLIRVNYASLSEYNSILGSYINTSPFSNVNIYMYHTKDNSIAAADSGRYLIYFPEMDNATYGPNTKQYSWGLWMSENIKQGKIVFHVTGVGLKVLPSYAGAEASFITNNNYQHYANDTDHLDFYNDSWLPVKATIQSYMFGIGRTGLVHSHTPSELSLDKVKHDYNICYFSRPEYYIFGNLSTDPNELGNRMICTVNSEANSNNNLWWYYSSYPEGTDAEKKEKRRKLLLLRRLGLFGPDQALDSKSDYTPIEDGTINSSVKTDVFKSYTYENESNYPSADESLIRGLRNYIAITTADDNTINCGGFILTAFYLSGQDINNSTVTTTIRQ